MATSSTTSYSTTDKGKMIFHYECSNYSSGSTRKDGSEVWKCVEGDCEGRILKRTTGITPDRKCTMIKEHTNDLPSAVRIISHLALAKLKNRAVSNLAVPPAEILKQTMTDIRDTIDAYMPSPNDMIQLILKWRSAEEESNVVDENMMTSPLPNKEASKGSRIKKTPIRKKAKIDIMTSPKQAVSMMTAATVSTLQDMNSSIYDYEDD